MTAPLRSGCLSMEALRSSRPILKSALWSPRRGIHIPSKEEVTEKQAFNEAQFAKFEHQEELDQHKSWKGVSKLVAPPNRADLARKAMSEWQKTRAGEKANEKRLAREARLQPYHPARGSAPIPKENVIYVRYLNKNLVHEDFYRTFPPGMDPRTVRVIPCRSKASGYQRTNSYYLVFSTTGARDIWRKWTDKMARDARRYTVETLQHPAVAPPAGFISKGVETDVFVKGWTLSPPRQLTSATDVELLGNFEDDDVIQRGGYDVFIPGPNRTQPYVILDIKGAVLDRSDILQAIAYDGVQRNLVWNVWSAMKYVTPLTDSSPRGFKEDEMRSQSRWKVPFQTVRDASNFARAWHARPFPWPPASYKLTTKANHARSQPENFTKVMTELAW